MNRIQRASDGLILQCLDIGGLPPSPGKQRLKTIEEEGVSGIALKYMGVKGDPKPIYPKFIVATPGLALSCEYDINTLQGSIISIEDGFNAVYSNYAVLQAEVLSKKKITGARWKSTTYYGGIIIRAMLVIRYYGGVIG